MENSALPWLLTMAIASLPWGVAFAVRSWRAASRSTQRPKSPPSPEGTPVSRGEFAKLEADVGELFSALSKNSTTLRRLSSRAGMEDVRARQAAPPSATAPPLGASKVELRRFYGLEGKSPREIAQQQLKLVANRDDQDESHG